MKFLRSLKGLALRNHIHWGATYPLNVKNETIVQKVYKYRKKWVYHVKGTIDCSRIPLQSHQYCPTDRIPLHISRKR